jgi:spore maturation protein CgeB
MKGQPTDNWIQKLKKNPAYIFYLIKKQFFSPARPDPKPGPEQESVPDQVQEPARPNLLCIMDVFTKSCFSPEFDMVCPTPENWKESLDQSPVDALFVESAWHGNDDAWQYRVGTYQERFMEPIRSLTDTCKERGIPTIFWNKEDPVHYEKFLDTARRFDYIFTTDADCIPGYKEQAGHGQVYALPFAAQPTLHNPILETARDGQVCFAGTYHAKRYADRRDDMDVILKPALDFGLDIYDRMHGADPKYAENYRFPDIYQPNIRGKLDYDEMVMAYRKYKVFLNVNSVRNSPTMFARRVLELLACGTPVISTYSKGIIEILGEDTVFITESEKETREYLEKLLGDETFWWKQSLHGIRKVLENHTYHHRTKEIFALAGIRTTDNPRPKFLVLSPVSSGGEIRAVSEFLQQQHYRDFKVLFLAESIEKIPEQALEEARNRLAPNEVIFIEQGSANLEKFIMEIPGYDYMAIMDPKHYYGASYLRDYALAIGYSGAGVLGKKSFFRMDNSGKCMLMNKGHEFRHTTDTPAASLVISNELLSVDEISKLLMNEMFYTGKSNIFSIDPFNFMSNYSAISQETLKSVAI